MPPQSTKNSHYIARHLTKPWEVSVPGSPRALWYYDFEKDRFGTLTSEKMFTRKAPFSQDVEDLLNRYLEAPLSNFLARFSATRDAEPSQKELRAMKLSVILQGARSVGAEADLHETLGCGEEHVDRIVSEVDRDYFEFVHFPLRAERLFLPDAGLVALPLRRSPPALALPLHPSFMVVAVPHACPGGTRQLESLLDDEDKVTALSAGLDVVRRLAIPGSAHRTTDESTMRSAIQRFRRRCIQLHAEFARATDALGDPVDPSEALSEVT